MICNRHPLDGDRLVATAMMHRPLLRSTTPPVDPVLPLIFTPGDPR
jgi:hypothetical protein